MYLTQDVLQVANGRNAPAVERLTWMHSRMQGRPGFLGAQICEYLGNSMRHLALTMWEDQAAHDAFLASPEGAGVAQTRPDGLWEPQPCGRSWQRIQECDGNAVGAFLIRSEFDVLDDRWDDYLTIRTGQDRIHQEAGGFQYSWNFREVGEGSGALLLVRKVGRKAHMDYVQSMQKSQLRQTNPTGVSVPRGEYMEYYEIICETTP